MWIARKSVFGCKDEIMAQDADAGLSIWDGKSADTIQYILEN